jgi:hypothetical protein
VTTALLDLDTALAFLEGDGELCMELLGTFQSVLEDAVGTLPELIARRDWGAASTMAHRLVPSLRIFCPVGVVPADGLCAAWHQRDSGSCETFASQLVVLLLGLSREIADCFSRLEAR